MPAYPWSQRPDDLPLTAEEVCEALYEAKGIVTRASILLKVGSLTLRKFVERSPRARAVIAEMNCRRGDLAVEKLDTALEDDSDARRQDWAIRYVLNSANARALGWSSTDDAASHALDAPRTNIVIQPVRWADGTIIGPKEAAKTLIELHPSAVSSSDKPDG